MVKNNSYSIWVIAADTPSLRGGAPVRNYNLIKQYINLGFAVELFCLYDSETKKDLDNLKKLGITVHSAPEPKIGILGTLWATAFLRILPFMHQYRRSALRNLLTNRLKHSVPNYIQLEQVNGYYAVKPLLEKVRKKGVRIILDAHNVEQVALKGSMKTFSFFKCLAGNYILPNYRRIEDKIGASADIVFTCSEHDSKHFKTLGNLNTYTIPNGVDIEYFVPMDDSTENTILFMGGLNYPPNNDAMRWYINKVHSQVKAEIPDIKLYIMGSKAPEWLLQAAKEDTTIIPIGYVEDVREYIQKAKVCISPIRQGSGTSLKILEYLASARAIVSTTVGIRGLKISDSENILIADTPDNFKDSVVRLLKDTKLRRKLSRNNRKVALEHYSWQNISLKIKEILGIKKTEEIILNDASLEPRKKLKSSTIAIVLLAWLFTVNITILSTVPTILKGLVIIPFLAFVIGFCVLGITKLKVMSRLHYLLYSVCLSLAGWLLLLLTYNNIALWVGYTTPLTKFNLTIFLTSVSLFFTLIFYLRNKRTVYDIPNIYISKESLVLMAISFVGLISMILGINVLNNGSNNYLVVGSLLSLAIVLTLSLRWFNKINSLTYVFILMCYGLALLLMYSLRSWHILGWDINLEYQVFQLTTIKQHWSMASAPGAEYNACISITLFPTFIHQLIGGSAEYVFKATIQFLFIVVPIGIFAICRNYVSQFYAFLAGVVYISQAWYSEQMPALVRQEIAFIFLIGSLLVMFDSKLTRKAKYILLSVLTLCIVISHYSTTYVWMLLLILSGISALIIKWRMPRLKNRRNINFFLLALLTLVLSVFWNSAYTKTSNNSEGFIKGTISHTSEVFTTEALLGGIQRIGFSSSNINTKDNLNDTYKELLDNYDKRKSNYNLYDNQKDYRPAAISDDNSIDGILPTVPSTILSMGSKVTKILFTLVFPVVGIFVTLKFLRKKQVVSIDYVSLTLASLPLILAVIFFPFVQARYNLTRLFMQLLVILALPTVVGGIYMLKPFKKYGPTILIAMLIVFMFYSKGLTSQIAGGTGSISLNHPASKYDSYYIYDTEIASSKWLSKETASTESTLVYADIIASLRLKGFAFKEETNVDIFPTTIDKNGYVYLGNINTQRGVAFLFFNGDTITYKYPMEFLDQNKDLIYSNDGSRIYK